MLNLIKTASVELFGLDSRQTVKIAGVLSRLKNYIRGLTNREYASSVEKLRGDSWQVQLTANELRKYIKKLTTAINDGDVFEYEASLQDVKQLTAQLATELSQLNQDAEQNKPNDIKPVADEIAPISAPPSRYGRDVWEDLEQRKKLFQKAPTQIKQWHPEHDVPFGEHINQPMKNFKWFDNKHIYAKEGSQARAGIRFAFQTVKHLADYYSIPIEESEKVFSDSKNFNELMSRLVESVFNGRLDKYTPEQPDKKMEVKQRPFGEMEMRVRTNGFIIPVYEIPATLLVKLTDLSTRQGGGDQLSIGFTQYEGKKSNIPRKKEEPKPEVKPVEPKPAATPIIPETPSGREKEWEARKQKKKSVRRELMTQFIKQAGADQSAAKNLPDSFWQSFVQMCNRLGAQPEHLAQVIYSESAFDPHATNVQHGKIIAKGLNQLIHPTAISLGMTEDQWQQYETTPATEQLQYVEKYFRNIGNATHVKQWDSPTQLYVANFAPKYVHKAADPNHVLYDSTTDQHAYEQNKALDRSKKGTITVSDLAQSVSRKLPDFIVQAISNAKNPQQDSMTQQEEKQDPSQDLVQTLFSYGPIESLVITALLDRLPQTNVLITISSLSAPHFVRQKFATAVTNVLRDTISATVTQQNRNDKIELQCGCAGTQYTAVSAIEALCCCVSDAVQARFGKQVVSAVIPIYKGTEE